MIPIYKLEKLPRTQKLRKIAKYFSFAESRFCQASENTIAEKGTEIFTTAEYVFFLDAAKLLAKDKLFSAQIKKVFEQAAIVFENAMVLNNSPKSPPSQILLRSLNSVKHLLLIETGKDQADWDFTVKDGSLDVNKRRIFKNVWLYLEDIRSPFNVGAIFRTAESFGVERIILSPFCADPRHRRAERTAMGCIDIILWERQDLFAEEKPTLPALPTLPILPIFALETGGTPIDEFSFPPQGIMIAGSEELGCCPRALAAADASLGRVSIPTYGAKASLNVSTAVGIALQKWAQRLAN